MIGNDPKPQRTADPQHAARPGGARSPSPVLKRLLKSSEPVEQDRFESDRIYRIDGMFFLNLVNPVNPVQSMRVWPSFVASSR